MPRWSMCEKQACVRCGSEQTVRCGRRKDGKQLWLCHGCTRRFTLGARLNVPLVARLTVGGKYRCPHCRATRTCLAGRTVRGTRILKCHACGKRTAVELVERVREQKPRRKGARCEKCAVKFGMDFPRSARDERMCEDCERKAPFVQWAQRAGL